MKYLYFYVTVFSTTIYLFYIQFSPTMGNIWIRNNKFAPKNAFNLMIHPINHFYMWSHVNMWPINYFIWLLIPLLFIQLDNLVEKQYRIYPDH